MLGPYEGVRHVNTQEWTSRNKHTGDTETTGILTSTVVIYNHDLSTMYGCRQRLILRIANTELNAK